VDRWPVDQHPVGDGGLGLSAAMNVSSVPVRLTRLCPRSVGPGSARAKTLAFNGGLLLLAVLLLLPTRSGPAEVPGQDGLTWWQLAALFAVAEVLVLHLEIRNEAHSFSFSEVPLLLGLVFASPLVLITSRLMGEAVALIGVERQRPGKLSLNLAVFLAESALAVAVFHLLSGLLLSGTRSATEPLVWLAGLTAVCLAGVFGNCVIWLVIRCHGGAGELGPMLLLTGVTTLGNVSLATVSAVIVTRALWALPALAVIVAVVAGAYREYGRLTRRYAALKLLFRLPSLTGDAVCPVEAIERILDQARDLLRAETSWIMLGPGHGSAVVVGDPGGRAAPAALPEVLQVRLLSGRDTVIVPRSTRDPQLRGCLTGLGVRDLLAAPLLRGRGEVVGAIVVANRLGHVSSFHGEDAQLLTAVAAQAGIALENGRLVERLHDQAQAREHEALHDALTGLPNRTLFSRELHAALEREGCDSRCAVLLMDLDQFKEVNDTLGHHTGDRLLQEVGDRLRATVGERGLVSRLGGDEFAVLVTDLSDAGAAEQLAHEVFSAVTQPVQLSTVMLAVGVGIGVAVQPEHGQDSTTLLQRADIAMYAAKRAHDPVALYSPSDDWNSELRLRLAGEIRGALHTHQVAVHYQPIVQTGGGRIEMVEALARWNHPELGELSPDQFIPIAERTGMIEPLTFYVLDSALAQCRQWQRAGLDVRVAVNLSIQVMLDKEWPDRVLGLLRTHDVEPDRLVLEITETTIMSDPARTVPAMRRLTDVGVQVGIDDFGTGYSSLSYLQRLPVSEIKIDKSFVAPMATDPIRRSIIRLVVELAHSLNMSTVAEGVEDQRTLDYLVGVGCDLVQGHWLSKPLPAAELTADVVVGLPGKAGGVVSRRARP
jgi:diguanylate cyclase (GGDEF)-like protein